MDKIKDCLKRLKVVDMEDGDFGWVPSSDLMYDKEDGTLWFEDYSFLEGYSKSLYDVFICKKEDEYICDLSLCMGFIREADCDKHHRIQIDKIIY